MFGRKQYVKRILEFTYLFPRILWVAWNGKKNIISIHFQYSILITVCSITYQWLNGKLQWLQGISNGVTTVLHLAINIDIGLLLLISIWLKPQFLVHPRRIIYPYPPGLFQSHWGNHMTTIPLPWANVHWLVQCTLECHCSATGWPSVHWDTTGRPSKYVQGTLKHH